MISKKINQEINKIKSYIKRIKNICKRWIGQFIYFSPKIAISDFLVSTILRKSDSQLKHNINVYYYSKAKKIIENKYDYVIKKWKRYNMQQEHIEANSKVFIFWWQGIENAPCVIKKCVESINNNSGQHECVIIDKDSWDKYTTIPEYILEKVRSNKINFTLFSDILRCCLLYDNGGIWIDPTCFMTSEFDQDIYSHSFYTIKHGDSWKHPICQGDWATFFLACNKNNPLLGYMKDMFMEYWKKEKVFIVYLSLDLFLSIAYDNFDYAKKMIDDVPLNNQKRDDMLEMLKKNNGEKFDELLEKMKESKTYINKLTYKIYIKNITHNV